MTGEPPRCGPPDSWMTHPNNGVSLVPRPRIYVGLCSAAHVAGESKNSVGVTRLPGDFLYIYKRLSQGTPGRPAAGGCINSHFGEFFAQK